MAKSPEMEAALEKIGQSLFGRSRGECKNIGRCVSCGLMVSPEDFRDALSLKEYGLSCLCQKCQDSVFGPPEDEILYDGSLDETDRYLERQAENFDGSTFGTVDEEMDYWYRINQ